MKQTMQMEIDKAIADQTVSLKQAQELVVRKGMTILGAYCSKIENNSATSPTYYIKD
jgi:hypothetical protein